LRNFNGFIWPFLSCQIVWIMTNALHLAVILFSKSLLLTRYPLASILSAFDLEILLSIQTQGLILVTDT
jgi:hypothetical protein